MSVAEATPRMGPSLLLAGVIAAVVMVGLSLVSPSEVAAPTIDGGAAVPALTVAQYLDTVEPLAREGGRIVQQGMKVGITDLGSGELDGELAVDSAIAWTRQMRQVGTDWAAIVPPEELADAHAAFVGALERYIGVGLVLEEAARADAGARQPFLDLAATEGEAADDAFDEAAAAVQALMRERGEPAVSWLPDPAVAEQD